jgi:hypothetical protein
MSSVYFAWPVMRRGSSRRLIAEPKMRVATSSSYFLAAMAAAAVWIEATMFW